ncbi:Cytosolic Fe-S cluster assembly factor nar1 [Arachnomyces sp. PD_36]|nr:Cytosolic Fe-S cluster assembly factor nar1 [Arachnomyces sp. PD_36]
MSAIISADDLNDFISPGVACIKPVETLPKKPENENVYEVTTEDKVEPENLPPAQISLTDCLACSGCVTSAEAVLVSLQSHAEVLNTLDAHPEIPILPSNGAMNGNLPVTESNEVDMLGNGQHDSAADGRIFVASVSPQVRASLAATYGISERKAGYMIEQFLTGPQGLRGGGKHGSGFSWVVDTNAMREACLTLSTDEVVESEQGAVPDSTEPAVPKKPILSSICPGWICYAEKTHPHVLPHLSRLKSPQALTGTMLKSILSKSLDVPPSQIWHLAIMPCFDKKLEASREELTDASWYNGSFTSQSPTRDVDCVITTREILMLASTRGITLKNLPPQPLPASHITPFPDQTLSPFLFPKHPSLQDPASGPSGGYLHHLLKTHESKNPGSTISAQRGRNADVVEYTLLSANGDPILKAARYYGFRNIQNLVRKLKPARKSRLPGARPATSGAAAARRAPASRQGGPTPSTTGATEYAYVEVMACPGGCTNGGGQIRVEDARDINNPSTSSNLTEQQQEEPQKPTPQEQRAWLSRVDEAYYSADSESDTDNKMDTSPRDYEKERENIRSILSYWSRQTEVPLSKLVYTTFRKVESDVGKDKNGNGAGDVERVIQLAGKAGGGW